LQSRHAARRNRGAKPGKKTPVARDSYACRLSGLTRRLSSEKVVLGGRRGFKASIRSLSENEAVLGVGLSASHAAGGDATTRRAPTATLRPLVSFSVLAQVDPGR